MDSKKSSDQREVWTNEKHVRYLNSMEASFVQKMLENNDRNVRLDRYLPDSSESTLDLNYRRRNNHINSVNSRGRADKQTRRMSSQPYIYPQDQVVPELEHGRDDKDETVN